MNIKTILKYLVYASAFMPLIIFRDFMSPFHFGKVVIFRSIIEIMLALYLVLILQDRSYLPRRDNFFWAFLAFVLAYTITSFTSVNIYQSVWGTLERMGGFYSLWHYFIFYIIAASVLRTRKEWETFLKITVGVGVLSAFYGFGQRLPACPADNPSCINSFFVGSGERARIFGTIGNAALFAGYQILNIFLAIIFGLTASLKNDKSERNFFLISAAVMIMAVLMTVVRGSILGLGAGLFLFAFLYFAQTNSNLAKKVIVSLLVITALFAGFTFTFKNSTFVTNSSYLHRITDLSLTSYTVQTRFWAWQAGLKGWRESPKKIVFGWGPENFNIPFSKYFNPKFFDGPGSETMFDRAHNMFVEVLVTMGLLGLLAYLGLFFVIFKSLWRLKDKPELRIPAIGLIAMIVAYVIHNAFIFDTSANLLVFFSVLGYVAYLNQPVASVAETKARKSIPASLSFVLATALCLVAIFIIYQTNIKTAEANYATTRGIVTGWDNNFSGAVAHYKEAVSYDVPGKYDYLNKYAQYLLDYSTSADSLKPEVLTAFKEVIALEEKNAAENPEDYLPELYLSRLNIILGKSDPKSPYNDEALKHALKALSYSKTFVRTYYEIAQVYLNKKDYPNALAQFQIAADLNPAVGLSYWYLGAVEMQMGRVDNALAHIDEAIKKGYRLSVNDYLNLSNIYIKRNDYQHLVGVYEGLVRLQPQKADYIAQLAVTYAHVGRIDDAVKVAHLAAQVDPAFERDARAFVQQLGRQW